MSSLKEYLADFFTLHYHPLEKKYPGIKFSRLSLELQNYLKRQSHFSSEPLDHYYNEFDKDETSLCIQHFFSHLKKGVPLEYITNQAFFYNSEFYVDEKVLIPRSETEILVENVLTAIKEKEDKATKKLSILDLGTGSGAMVLSILMESNIALDAVASDISIEALEVAKINYFHLKYKINSSSKLDFILSDRFKNIDRKFDLIISNPPYIKRRNDLNLVHTGVDKFEPHIALYLDDDIYDTWFDELFFDAFSCLEDGGLFFMEGHEDHLCNLLPSLNKIGFKNCKIIKDYTQRNRFIFAEK